MRIALIIAVLCGMFASTAEAGLLRRKCGKGLLRGAVSKVKVVTKLGGCRACR